MNFLDFFKHEFRNNAVCVQALLLKAGLRPPLAVHGVDYFFHNPSSIPQRAYS